jgi:hypothetical protein
MIPCGGSCARSFELRLFEDPYVDRGRADAVVRR